jgi:hypothetical protein
MSRPGSVGRNRSDGAVCGLIACACQPMRTRGSKGRRPWEAGLRYACSWYIGGTFDPLHFIVGWGAQIGWHTDLANPTNGLLGGILHQIVDLGPYVYIGKSQPFYFQCSINSGCH